MKVFWLRRAEVDFDSIVDFIAEDNPVAAINQGDEIEGQVSALKDHPRRGRRGRVEGTLELIIVRTPYIAAYRIEGQRIEILRILHSAQPWTYSF